MNEQMRDPVELERRKRLLEAEFLNPDQSLGLLPEDYGQPGAPLYDDSQSVQVAGVDRAVLPSRDIASDEEQLTMPLPPRKQIKIPVSKGKTLYESRQSGEAPDKYIPITPEEEKVRKGVAEQGYQEGQVGYEAMRRALEADDKFLAEQEGRDPKTLQREKMINWLMDAMEEAKARRNAPVDPANPISAMLLGLGGGLAGAYSGQPNTGHLIAGSAIKARDDAMERRLKLIDTTPEVKGILAAMKMQEERDKNKEDREFETMKMRLQNLWKVAQYGRETNELALRADDSLARWRQTGKANELAKARLDIDRLKEAVGKQEKKSTALKDFGKKLTEMGMPGTRQGLKHLESTLGVGLHTLSENPEGNKELATKLGLNLATAGGTGWWSDIDQIKTINDPIKRNKLIGIRGDVQSVIANMRKAISGASLTPQESEAFESMLGSGKLSSSEAFLSGIRKVYNRFNADRRTLVDTYSTEVPKESIFRQYPEFSDSQWDQTPSVMERARNIAPTVGDRKQLEIRKQQLLKNQQKKKQLPSR